MLRKSAPVIVDSDVGGIQLNVGGQSVIPRLPRVMSVLRLLRSLVTHTP